MNTSVPSLLEKVYETWALLPIAEELERLWSTVWNEDEAIRVNDPWWSDDDRYNRIQETYQSRPHYKESYRTLLKFLCPRSCCPMTNDCQYSLYQIRRSLMTLLNCSSLAKSRIFPPSFLSVNLDVLKSPRRAQGRVP